MQIGQVRELALSLPEATEEPHFHYASYRVRGKIFLTVPPEEAHIHVFVGETEREMALALYPEFVEPLHWGKRVVGLRLTLADAQPAAVEHLIRKAWEHKAPRRLAATVHGMT